MPFVRSMKRETEDDFSSQPAKLAKSRHVIMTKLPFARPGEKPWFKLWVQIALVVAVASLAVFKLRPTSSLTTYLKRH